MSHEELKALIALHSKPELAEKPGMVRQVWEDGEITCQKSGSLLWQRSLHQFSPGFDHSVPIELFPHHEAKHGYVFTDEQGSEIVRAAIRDSKVV